MIGLALKNMLSDLFNCISLPVKVGDWIEVGGARGRVIQGHRGDEHLVRACGVHPE